MKKVRNLLITFLGVLALTGCAMKYETNMAITEDGKMDFALIAAYDKEFITNMMSMADTEGEEETTDTTTTPTDEELANYFYSSVEEEQEAKQEATKIGFTLSRYQEGEFIGYKYLATIDDIKTVSSDTDVVFDLSKVTDSQTPITQAMFFKKTGNVYTANFTFDPANQNVDSGDLVGDETTEDGSDTSSSEEFEQYLSQMLLDYSFKLTLPVAPTSHNATSVSEDGKTLTWTLSSTEVSNINFVFELADKTATTTSTSGLSDEMMMYIGIGAIALVLIIVIIILVAVRSKKKKKMAVPETVNEVAPTTSVDTALNATPAVDLGNGTIVDNAVASPMVEQTPVVESAPVETPVVETPAIEPIVNSTPVVETEPAPATPVVEVTPATPVVEQMVNSMPDVASTPVVESAPVETPVVENVVNSTPVEVPVTPVETPVVETPSVIEIPTEPVVNPNVTSPIIDTVVVGENATEPTNQNVQ